MTVNTLEIIHELLKRELDIAAADFERARFNYKSVIADNNATDEMIASASKEKAKAGKRFTEIEKAFDEFVYKKW